MIADLQRAIARALVSVDPVAALSREAAGLSPEDRERLARIDPDGFRLTGLIVAKLRFERIVRGDDRMREWFRLDPEGFTRGFRAYVADVPPTARFPRREAARFHAWCVETGRIPAPPGRDASRV